MKEIITDDGSVTFFNEYFQDVYNSKTGAMQEAREKFVIPCKIPELAKKGKIKILDICFGIGYNSLLAIHEALISNPDVEIEIIGLENDPEVIEQIQKMKFKDEFKKEYAYIQKQSKGKISVTIIEGDALETIKPLGKFDAVFLDPFTPKTCAHMWAEDLMKEITKHMKDDAILATYSCARMVRDNMKKAGLKVFDGPKVGRFAPSTYCTL